MRRFLIAAFLAIFALAQPTAVIAGNDLGPRPPGQFDLYVLSLTWVPGFCATHRASSECSKGLGFALHGLWPQFNSGDYPTQCQEVILSNADRANFSGIYPDPSMIDHEWPKHGTCSGLSPSDYFALSSADQGKVAIPPDYAAPRAVPASSSAQIIKAFLQANLGMTADGIRVISAGRSLGEVRICLTKAGDFRGCTG